MANVGSVTLPGAKRTPLLTWVAAVICCVAVTDGCAHVSNHGGVPPSTLPPSTLVLADRIDHLEGVVAAEPMGVEHPDGTLFVSGYGGPGPNLWRSQDHGTTWTRVNVGSAADGAIGNSDVDLAIAYDGTLYFVAMGFDGYKLEGRSIAIGVTSNEGATWRWTMLSKERFDDRPWVAVAADGTAHVIWNDGSGVRHAVSRDGGAIWTERPRIHHQGGSSHLAVGPNGEIAVRVTPLSASTKKFDPGVNLIAVSTDGGAIWQDHPAPDQRQWSASSFNDFPPRWVEPLAWDAEGALYSFWADGKVLWLARSLDRGETWTSWRVAEGDEVSYFPYLTGRGRGELAATWFSGRGETLQAHVARFDVRNGATPPRIIELPFRPDNRSTAGEYLAVMFLKTGGLSVVSPLANGRERHWGFSWWRFEAR